MKPEASQPILTAVFVDYDNIYLSLKRRSEEAAKRFAKEASSWIKDIEAGRIITPTNSPAIERPRRILLSRCYGNPVPGRNPNDNTTDMSSFPFVRQHFTRAGFEVIDCPPLTARQKNASDIRMVMDLRDFLTHDTRFEEFVILSSDADFTPVLHRLRAYNRRTVIFANDYTAAPYTALCDGEVRESHLMAILLGDRQIGGADKPALTGDANAEVIRAEIISVVAVSVRTAGGPVPLEALAERTTRALGHDRTVGTQWAGAGSFLELLRTGLPGDIRLTDQPPYLAYEAKRGLGQAKAPPAIEPRERIEPALAPPVPQPRQAQPMPTQPVMRQEIAQSQRIAAPMPPQQPQSLAVTKAARPAPSPAPAPAAQHRQAEVASALQQSIARIHEACQAPPLSPPEYRALFEVMAKEISDNGLQGAQTLSNIVTRAQELGIEVRRDDVRFILEVVSEADPWFEQGASATVFAGRFRNFVVARCRSQNLNLSSDELDLIEAWFAGSGQPIPAQHAAPRQQVRPAPSTAELAAGSSRGWSEPGVPRDFSSGGPEPTGEEFPKILRTRLRG